MFFLSLLLFGLLPVNAGLNCLVKGCNDWLRQAEFYRKYTVNNTLLGVGGLGEVRLCTQKRQRTLRVCKFTAMDPVETMNHEIATLSILRNATHVVQLVDYFRLPRDGKVVIVMEYLPGYMDLETYLKQSDVRDPQKVRCIFTQLVEATGYMHSKGYVHADLKPRNTLIDPRTLDVKLIDFGASALITPISNAKRQLTPAYSAPEAIRGIPFDPVAEEVWSLGVCFFELLYGFRPFSSRSKVFAQRVTVLAAGRPIDLPLDNFVLVYDIAQPTWAKLLLQDMLEEDPDFRPSISEILARLQN